MKLSCVYFIKLCVFGRYELHEWVYQLHNSLDEFKKKEHGIYAIVANSSPLENLGDDRKKQDKLEEPSEPQGIYAVVRKDNSVKPTRQAPPVPPVPPRSKEMAILTDETPPDSAVESNGTEGEKGREILVSIGSGSDTDYLAQFRKHKRSLSDSLVITKAIDLGPSAVVTSNGKATSTIKKTSSATNLTDKLGNDKGFELPASVVKRKRMNRRRKTIAHGGRRLSRSHSPPSEPPPPPPSGEKPEVNQAIIDALYALDEELGQNVEGESPNNTTSPIQLDHTTVFATFQSPTHSAYNPTSPTTGHILSPPNSAQHKMSNGAVVHKEQQNGHGKKGDETDSDNVDESHCIKPSAAAGKAKLDEVKGSTPKNVPKAKKGPPPVKPKPYKPSPPLRSTSYNRTAEVHSNKTVQSSETGLPSSLKLQNKVTEQQKRSPTRVTFPEELERAISKKSFTTFSLDDVNKEVLERGGMKGSPLSPTKVKSEPVTRPKHDDDSSILTTSSSMTHSGTEESMAKIFQNWPNQGLTNGSLADPMSPVHSEPSQWRDSMADQHIYDDPWDKKMRAAYLSKSQGSLKSGDRNSLERRRTFSNGLNGGRMDRNPLEQRNNVVTAPRRGASIDDLYNKSASTAFTANFKKGASSENLNTMDQYSPLYLYKKALKNHEQQQQQVEEKERSSTLPLKGARRRSQLGQYSVQTSLRPQIANGPTSLPPRTINTAQNDIRKYPLSPQQPQSMQYQRTTNVQSPQTQQPPRRTNITGNNYPKVNANYRPYILNTGGRPITTTEQNGIIWNRRPMNFHSQMPTPNDWQYYQSGTRISYDKDSDTTILRSLV